MNFILSEKAKMDLMNIWDYTFHKWSESQATKYYNLILDKIEELKEYPKLGQVINEVKMDYWKTRVQSHFIFYKINLKKNEIEIIRILHQQMDIDSRLNE